MDSGTVIMHATGKFHIRYIEVLQQAAMQDMVRADRGSCGAGSIARESFIGCTRLSN